MVNMPGDYQDKVGCAAQWDPACPATSMTMGDNGKYTLTVQLPAGNYEFKIAEGGNWTVNYGSGGQQDGQNYRVKVTADSAVTFVYDTATHMVTTSSKAAAIATAAPPNVLIATGGLPAGGQILSLNKLYRFEVQPTGALVLYDSYTNKQLWSSQTKGDPNVLVMQDDGNLVLYAKNGSVIWASEKTGKTGDYFLTLQDDGNLVVYQGSPNGANITPIWATNTAR